MWYQVDATRFLGAWLRAGEGIGWLAAGTMPNSLYRMPLVYLFLTCVFCYSCSFLFVVFFFFVCVCVCCAVSETETLRVRNVVPGRCYAFFGCMAASRGGYRMARGRHYAKLSLSNAPRLSFSDLCILLFLFLSLCRFFFFCVCVCVFVFFFCSHWSLVDVPLIFFCPADHVLPDWQPRVLLGMVEARSVNVKNTTTTTTTIFSSSRLVGVDIKGSK